MEEIKIDPNKVYEFKLTGKEYADIDFALKTAAMPWQVSNELIVKLFQQAKEQNDNRAVTQS